jgi:hypothetical protein
MSMLVIVFLRFMNTAGIRGLKVQLLVTARTIGLISSSVTCSGVPPGEPDGSRGERGCHPASSAVSKTPGGG